ncbi:MAG: hypothetical protein AAGA95_01725 [Pseudomonadota bacterium]
MQPFALEDLAARFTSRPEFAFVGQLILLAAEEALGWITGMQAWPNARGRHPEFTRTILRK